MTAALHEIEAGVKADIDWLRGSIHTGAERLREVLHVRGMSSRWV